MARATAVDGGTSGGGQMELPTSGGEHRHASVVTRLLLLPVTFDGTGN